jgi:hypothetical protein
LGVVVARLTIRDFAHEPAEQRAHDQPGPHSRATPADGK